MPAKIDIIDLLKKIEELIDSRVDMMLEKKYHNSHEMVKIEETRYIPIREEILKTLLTISEISV